jgi:hypothetical protein
MNIIGNKSFRRVLAASALGWFAGFNLALVLTVFLLPSAAQATADRCGGRYPCFTPRACEAAHGSFIRCPEACPGEGVQRGYCYARQESIPLTVTIGGLRRTIDLGEYIQAVYNYGVAIAGIFAAVMIMVGGIQWLTAAGDSGRVSAAQKRITDASIGLFLTIFAWFILNTINPSLVVLQMPRIPMVRQERLVRCDLFRMERPCGVEFGVKANDDAPDTAEERDRFIVTEVDDPDILTTCTGKNCVGASDCTAGGCTCQRTTGASTTPETGTAATDSSNGWECRPCIAAGQECQGLGPCDTCCGGYCGAVGDMEEEVVGRGLTESTAGTPAELLSQTTIRGSCSNGMNGIKCGSASECVGGYCVDVSDYAQFLTFFANYGSGIQNQIAGAYNMDWSQWLRGIGQAQTAGITSVAAVFSGGICSNGSVGAPCNDNDDCTGGNQCIDSPGAHVCAPAIVGGPCIEGSCPEGSVCSETTGGGLDQVNRCVRQIVEDGSYCGRDNTQCAEWFGEDFRCEQIGSFHTCINGRPGTLCTGDQHCLWSDTSGTHQGKCNLGGVLDLTPDTGICTDGTDGNGCYDNDDCLSGYCHDFEGWGKICIGPHTEPDSPCVPGEAAGQCSNGMSCAEGSQTCIGGAGRTDR